MLFTSCIHDSTLDYKDINAVVVVKSKHIFKNLFVPECEFNLYNIGDTIK